MYLLEITGSAEIFATALAMSTLPYIIFAPIAGQVADNFNRKRIMIVLDVLSSVMILLYLLFSSQEVNQTILSVGIMCLLSSIHTFYSPAVSAIIPQIVEKEQLMKANGLISQAGSFANLGAPVIAGILYGFTGIYGVTILNGFSFILSAALEGFIILPSVREKKKVRISYIQSLRDMKESFLYLKSKKKETLKIIYSYGLQNICLVPVLSIIFPYVIREKLSLSASFYGVVEGVAAGGMILAGILVIGFPWCFSVRKIYKWNYITTGSLGLMILSLIYIQQPVIIAMLWMVGGFGIMMALGIGNIVTQTYNQSVIEEKILGKTSAFSTAIATITVPIGQIIFGYLLEYLGNIPGMILGTLLVNLMVIQFIKKIFL